MDKIMFERNIEELKKATGLDENNRAWEEAYEQYPREIELMEFLIQEYVDSCHKALSVIINTALVLPESVRELSFDRLVATQAVNVLNGIDEANDVLTKP